MVEMEYVPETDMAVTILKYPETRDDRFFKSDAHMNDFESNIIISINKNIVHSALLLVAIRCLISSY